MIKHKFVDDYLHLGHRRRLVQSLRAKGIKNDKVLEAIGRVPRHWFVGKAYEALAYEDRPLPIGRGQTISQPSTVAKQTILLEVEPQMKVLEIGTGSGYQAAILGQLSTRVFSLERHEPLHAQANQILKNNRFGKIRCFLRDGFNGLPVYGPYDRILVTAGAVDIPQALLHQLTIGGQLIIPVGNETQVMKRIKRVDKDKFVEESFGKFRFVPFKQGLEVDRPENMHPRFRSRMKG